MTRRFLEPHEPLPLIDGATVGDFWRWAYSDVLSNANLSVFAEFLVGSALGCLTEPREEWESVDLHYAGFAIEVKASAHCQAWYHAKPSPISYSIKKAGFWNKTTGKYEGESRRWSDCYVFCHYPERDRTKANVLDVPAWDFYVIATSVVNRVFGGRKSVSLASIKPHAEFCKFDHLKTAVDGALGIAVAGVGE